MLIYQTLLYLPAQLLGPAFQFLAAVAWTHWLSPAEYGVLSLVIAAQELVFCISLSWWSQYTTRYYAAHLADRSTGRFQPTENGVILASIGIQAVVGFVALAVSDAPLDAGLVVATLLFTITRSIAAHFAERGRASGRIGSYTLAQTAGPVLGCLIGFLAIAEGFATATAVLASFALAQGLVLPLLWRSLSMGLRLRFDRDIVATALRYGTPLLIAGVITWFSVNGLRFVIDRFEGAAAVGLVSVGWSLGQRAALFGAMLVTAAAYPLAVRRAVTHSRQAALLQLSQSGALLFGIIAPITVGLLIVNKSAVSLLIGAQFQSLTLVILPIAVLSGAVRNLRLHYADQAFLLCETPRVTLLVCAVEAALTLPLCLFGLLQGGLAGACLGCLAAHILAALLSFVLAVRRFALPLPWSHAGRIAIATAVMGLCLQYLPWTVTRIGLAAEVVSGAAVYAIAIAIIYRQELRALLVAYLARQAAPAAE